MLQMQLGNAEQQGMPADTVKGMHEISGHSGSWLGYASLEAEQPRLSHRRST